MAGPIGAVALPPAAAKISGIAPRAVRGLSLDHVLALTPNGKSRVENDGMPDNLPIDVARLSPLGDKHINVQGRYHFTITDALLKGELRPLHNPDEMEELVRREIP